MNLKITRKLIGIVTATAIASAVPLIEEFEGTEYTTYSDTGNVATVCTGHTGIGVEWRKIYTKEECDKFLTKDLKIAAEVIDNNVKIKLSDQEATAYLSFIFNVGGRAFISSTLLHKLNMDPPDRTGACHELTKWVYDNGVRLRGLERRRQAEYNVCMQGATGER